MAVKFSEVVELSQAELVAKGREMRQELFNLKLQKASSQLEKPSRLRDLRRGIARVETQLSVLRQQADAK
ncbi:50S ribosomal protein L29 [Verrucomicrobia bacterium]|jgi:large subunit ribosomal protein L29|nr:50S ribosomal protein L29 [Pedosphaera sp.]MBL6843981.1 50S ribosomal protein L29 [Verrucomicrobiae bacterium]MDA7524735.1 50S ribosomal protein L29 [Verrucomicrobiota bacterium]RZO72988.1 MAG: 50S ribosomal protein L29 [Limisphaerales bacterium]HAQ98073.1 50S ribosomal protein L29 [Verrucomicrobiales bacterium]|tara:strand:- start:3343 stop:3552 length:210 start_codon:yes stop_codon:yes gene_type:complete